MYVGFYIIFDRTPCRLSNQATHVLDIVRKKL